MRENISALCFVDTPSLSFNRFLFDFEKNFNYWQNYYWYVDNWKLCLYIVGIYLVVIFGGQQLMKSRPPFRLRKSLFVWNFGLALFNIALLIRTVPIYVDGLQEIGFHALQCYLGDAEHKQATGVWIYFFSIAKVVELGDTVFIVLRKKPLLIVHWYHHASVLVYVWSSSVYPSGIHPAFGIANGFVHAFMYSYLALKAINVPIPKATGMLVTILELIQLGFGVCLTIYGYFAKVGDEECCIFDQAILLSVLLYLSYLFLFTNFFIRSYVSKKPLLEIMGVKKQKTA